MPQTYNNNIIFNDEIAISEKHTEREGLPAAAVPMMAERAKRENFILVVVLMCAALLVMGFLN